MKIGSMETPGARSASVPRVITLPERSLADRDERRRNSASAQARFWVRTSNYAWSTGVVAVGIGLHFYYMGEMLVSLALFSLFFLALSLVALGVFWVCFARHRAAIWADPASRVVIPVMQDDL